MLIHCTNVMTPINGNFWNLSLTAVRYGRVPKRSREVITSAEADQSSYDGTPHSASPGSNSSSEGSTICGSSNNNSFSSNTSPTSSSTSDQMSVTSTLTCSKVNPLAAIVTQTHLQHCIYTQDKVREVTPRKLTLVSVPFVSLMLLTYSCLSITLLFCSRIIYTHPNGA